MSNHRCARTTMARRLCLLLFLFATLLLASCQRAQRYAAPPPKPDELPPESKEEDKSKGRYRFIWQEPRGDLRDLPIQFVPESASEEWRRLPAFWTNFPLAPLQLAQDPLQAAVATVVTDQVQAVKIKVPRG